MHFKEMRRWEQQGYCGDCYSWASGKSSWYGDPYSMGWESGDLGLELPDVFGFSTGAVMIKTDLMRGQAKDQRALVLDGEISHFRSMEGCGSFVARMIIYKEVRTLIKEVTELHFRTWLCSDQTTKGWGQGG